MAYLIPDKIYNVLKWVCIVALPIVAWGYGALAAEWGWPMADQIVDTIHIVAVILGGLLGIDEVQAKVRSAKEVEDAE